MGELQQFVAELLEEHGAVVEPVDPEGLDVLRHSGAHALSRFRMHPFPTGCIPLRSYVKPGFPQPFDHPGNDGRIDVPPFELEHGFVGEIRIQPQDFVDLVNGFGPAPGLAVDHRQHIQRGCSLLLPPEVMGAHIGPPRRAPRAAAPGP